MSYAIVIEGKVAQLSPQPIEVAAPIECVSVPEGVTVHENWLYSTGANGQGVFTAPPEPEKPAGPTLKEQAQAALQQARGTIYNNYGIFNDPTPDAWLTYLRALMAIKNGTDTASTTLPTAPSDPTQ